MARKIISPAAPALRAWTAFLILLFAYGCTHPPEISTVTAELRGIEVVISTNGVIEPTDDTGIYAPVDGFVKAIRRTEGSEVTRGQALLQLDASQARLALAEAQASLLEARRQAQTVLSGPARQELDSLKASMAENHLQLQQVQDDLSTESLLYRKGAVSRESVERLSKQQELLQVRAEALKQEQENLLARYTEEEKEWEKGKVAALAGQVQLLERQVREESVTAPADGTLYSLAVKTGAFVSRGQLLGRLYRSGQVRLRAYVDEPDLGRIHKGQPVTIEWDGMPDRKWTGVVESPANQVVELNNRSVGHILCSIDGQPDELIPNTNVEVKIVTDSKEQTLVVPRSSVFRKENKFAVLISGERETAIRPVTIGLSTYDQMEILEGIKPGDALVLDPMSVLHDQ